MGSRSKDKKEIDPEELMRKKFHFKCLFRALGRKVMANAHWLIEDVDKYEGVDDVKRRVEQAVRGKTKKKQLLTIRDKALLNKPAEDRTDQEKKYIYRIIGGLKCFKRYPNHVKKKLAALTYFKYYGPGRAVVRQHHEAHAMYFIVTGEVMVSQMVFDELLQRYASVELGLMHPGDMFGEVSLLHNIPRTATCTTTGHCEFLALMKEDFKNVLLASVQKQWDEVLQAMSAFTYFDALDEVARREGCIVARMKSFEVNETVLGDGVGVANFVYFILSGRCQMIESLQVLITERLGRTYYSLHDPYVPPEESEQDIDKKYFAAYKGITKESGASILSASETEKKELVQPSESATIEIGERTESVVGSVPNRQSIRYSVLQPTSRAGGSKFESGQILKDPPESRKQSGFNSRRSSSALRSRILLAPSVQQARPSVRYSTLPEKPLVPPPNLRTYFMQVCQLNPGSTFGFGENMRDRRIVALTPMDCMLMPKIWLLQRNTANIWSRIQYYLEKKIPSKKQLFKEFVSQRRWLEYREQLVEDVMARSKTVNYTSIHDVPYSIRIEEMLDI